MLCSSTCLHWHNIEFKPNVIFSYIYLQCTAATQPLLATHLTLLSYCASSLITLYLYDIMIDCCAWDFELAAHQNLVKLGSQMALLSFWAVDCALQIPGQSEIRYLLCKTANIQPFNIWVFNRCFFPLWLDIMAMAYTPYTVKGPSHNYAVMSCVARLLFNLLTGCYIFLMPVSLTFIGNDKGSSRTLTTK